MIINFIFQYFYYFLLKLAFHVVYLQYDENVVLFKRRGYIKYYKTNFEMHQYKSKRNAIKQLLKIISNA